MVRAVCILGATGSVGRRALQVIAEYPDRYRVVSLSGHENVALLAEQCRVFSPDQVVVASADAASRLRGMVEGVTVLEGPTGLDEIAADPRVDTVIAGIVGAAGLSATIVAVRAGKRLLLANKEALIMAGKILLDEARRSGAELLPVDSEHSALFQVLPERLAGAVVRPQQRSGSLLQGSGVRRLWLTASGGPFWNLGLDDLSKMTPAQACAHPVWEMGTKISVDSATMANKGLEVMEASLLFATPQQGYRGCCAPGGGRARAGGIHRWFPARLSQQS